MHTPKMNARRRDLPSNRPNKSSKRSINDGESPGRSRVSDEVQEECPEGEAAAMAEED